MRKVFKKVISIALLLALVFLQNVPMVLAASITVDNEAVVQAGVSYRNALDSVVDSSGDVHMIGNATTDGSNWALKYYKWNGTSWSSQTIETTSGGAGFVGDIAIDSNDNLGIAWIDTAGATPGIKYSTSTDGTSWGTMTANATSSVYSIALDYFPSSNEPYIAVGFTYLALGQLVWNGSGFDMSYADTEDTADDIEVLLEGSQEVHLLVVRNDNDDVHYFHSANKGSSFDEPSYILLGQQTDSDSNIDVALESGEPRFVVASDMNPTDYIIFGFYNGSTWATSTVASGNGVGGFVGMTMDGTTEYVCYHDTSGTNAFKYAYTEDNGSTAWNTGVISNTDIYSDAFESNACTIAQTSSNNLVAVGTGMGAGAYFKSWTLAYSAGGGEGVPEFSTYVYIFTVMAAGWMIYTNMNKEENIATSN